MFMSPSSRRAWIEIFDSTFFRGPVGVALLAEGVDRNIFKQTGLVVEFWSPSSRRAWIEIASLDDLTHVDCVALLAEGVDRNPVALLLNLPLIRRPPRGGRG